MCSLKFFIQVTLIEMIAVDVFSRGFLSSCDTAISSSTAQSASSSRILLSTPCRNVLFKRVFGKKKFFCWGACWRDCLRKSQLFRWLQSIVFRFSFFFFCWWRTTWLQRSKRLEKPQYEKWLESDETSVSSCISKMSFAEALFLSFVAKFQN